MGRPFLPLAARRRRGGGGGVAPSLPVNVTPPTLVLLNDTTLQYTRGVWSGTPPITFEAELEINGTFVRVVQPGPIAIEPAWLGGSARIWEIATNSQGSVNNVMAGPVQLPAPPLSIVSAVVSGATLTLTVAGGLAPYQVEFGDDTDTDGDGPVFTHDYAFGAAYVVRVRDDNSDEVTQTVTVPQLGPLTFVSGTISKGMFGSRSGQFTFSGGFGPFTVTDVPADPLFPSGTIMEQRRSWLGTTLDTYLVTVADSAGARFVLKIDYTGLPNDQSKPITVASPEDVLVSWLAGRVGYALDPNDIGSLFRDTAGTLPITADGQPVALARSRFDPVSPAVADFTQSASAQQPAYQAGSLDPDGVDDIIIYNYSATAVMPIFQGLNGFVVSVFVELSSLATNQVIWVSGFGGTAANFRHRIRITTAGAIQFSAQDAQNTAAVSVTTANGLITVGAKALITLAVDHDAKVLKGYLNGVEVASLALPNTVSPFNYDINRARFFAGHGNTATELFGGRLYRAFFFHGKVDAVGRQIIEEWVGEDPPPPAQPILVARQWEQPRDFSSLPVVNDLVEHNGQIWKNAMVTPNLWEPGIFGWEATT